MHTEVITDLGVIILDKNPKIDPLTGDFEEPNLGGLIYTHTLDLRFCSISDDDGVTVVENRVKRNIYSIQDGDIVSGESLGLPLTIQRIIRTP